MKITELYPDALMEIMDWLEMEDVIAFMSTCQHVWSLRRYYEMRKRALYEEAYEEVEERCKHYYRGGNGSFKNYWHWAIKEVYEEFGLRFQDYDWRDDEDDERASVINFPYKFWDFNV
jgi:hypothetical protein